MAGFEQLANVNARYQGFTRAGVVIIGGGFSGMCMAIKLLEAGIDDFVILEKSTGFGGTWKDNAYPGCCCDVFSHLYCYSFEQNPNWTRLYPEQTEILNYAQNVARKHDLYKYVRFSSEVNEAKWDEAAKLWKVKVCVLAGKEAESCNTYTIETSYVVTGLGQLNTPFYPNIAGKDTFQGKVMHSARWDWSYDLRGKRVGIIGNGATAVQVIPEVAKVASQLTIFQRSPNWVIPRLDRNITGWQRSLLRNVPYLLTRFRAVIMDGRESFYDSLIDKNSKQAAEVKAFCENYIKQSLPDRPDLWDTLTPKYPPGCKRILISDDYFASLSQPNVTLETRPIQQITETGVDVESNGEHAAHEFDVLIFATGFETMEFTNGIDVHGVGPKSLKEIWSKGASALYGIGVESLPNFGMLYGPNTNLGHNSIILMIEAQTRYVTSLIKEVYKGRKTGQPVTILPRTARVEEYNTWIQGALSTSSFADPRCQSWYKNADGLVTNNWSGTVIDYQKLLSTVDWTDYTVEGDEKAPTGKQFIGRVVEETVVSTTALLAGTTISLLAAGALLYQARGRFRLR